MKTSLLGLTHSIMSLWAIALVLIVGPNVGFSRQHESQKTKAWLGVTITDVTDAAAKSNKLADQTGALVTDVTENSPADSVGIKERDIIVEFGKKEIDDANDLVKAVAKSSAGDEVIISYLRQGEKKSAQVVLTKFPHRRLSPAHNFFRQFGIVSEGANEGMQLIELNDQLGEYFGAPKGTGILVSKVRKGSAAEKAGIKAGDVLLKIGKRTIDDLEDVSKALSKYDEGDKVDVNVLRKGAEKTLSLEVAEDRNTSMFDMLEHRGPDGEAFIMPWFKGKPFEFPNWNDQDYRFEFHNMRPKVEVHPRKIDESTEVLEGDLRNLGKEMRDIQVRSI